MLTELRGRLDAVHPPITALRAEREGVVARLRRKNRIVVAVFLAGIIAGLVTTKSIGLAIILAVILFVVWLVGVGRIDTQTALLARIEFVDALLEGLRLEVLPRAKIALAFDASSTTDGRHLDRTAQSISGNVKRYYKQRWLRLALTLPDGSLVQIARKDFMKSKKGAIDKHHRFASVKLQLPPDRQMAKKGVKFSKLRDTLATVAREHFHDPPEAIDVHPSVSDGFLRIKVVQHDAPFLANEVIALVGGALEFAYAHASPVDAPRG